MRISPGVLGDLDHSVDNTGLLVSPGGDAVKATQKEWQKISDFVAQMMMQAKSSQSKAEEKGVGQKKVEKRVAETVCIDRWAGKVRVRQNSHAGMRSEASSECADGA